MPKPPEKQSNALFFYKKIACHNAHNFKYITDSGLKIPCVDIYVKHSL